MRPQAHDRRSRHCKPSNKGMKLTSVERIGRSQLIPGVRRTNGGGLASVAFSKVEQRSIEGLLTAYCERRVPPQVRDQVRVLFRIRGESVTLLESRPSFVDRSDWIEHVVAQL
jgi:hypothetical protein